MRNALIPHFLCQAEKPAWRWGREADVGDADWRALARQMNMVRNQVRTTQPFSSEPQANTKHFISKITPKSFVCAYFSSCGGCFHAPHSRAWELWFLWGHGASSFLSRAGITRLYNLTASSHLHWRDKITGCWEHSEQDLHPTWACGFIFCYRSIKAFGLFLLKATVFLTLPSHANWSLALWK